MELVELKASGLVLSHHARNHWFVGSQPNTITAEMLSSPDYWVHVKGQLNRGQAPDCIEVMTEDGSKYFEVMVFGKITATAPDYAFRVIRSESFEAKTNKTELEDGKYVIEFSGQDGWRVQKRQGRGYTTMITNLTDEMACYKWLEDHKKALAA